MSSAGIQMGGARLRGGSISAALLLLVLLALPGLCRAQQPQTISFLQPAQQAYAGTSVALAATATSGLPVTFTVASGPAQVSGTNGSTLAFTGVGTVVVQADQAGGNGYSAAPSVQSQPINVLLLSAAISAVADLRTLVTFTVPGVVAQGSILTQGAANLDFTADQISFHGGANDCNVGAFYAAGTTCFVSFRFQPTLPGIRYGGITLADAAGNLLANSYIYGYGVGPQVLYAPIVQSLVGSSQGGPSGVAINGRGDLFVSNYTGSGLVEIAANGTVSPVGSFINGRDVAVDGSGNVFVVTYDTLYEVVAVNGSIPAAPVIRTLATGFTVSGGGLAIDGSGNAYIANTPSSSTKANPQGVVYEVLAVGGIIPAASAKVTIGPIFPEPTGVAVDSSGNVYISDGQTPAVFEMLAVNGRVPASPTIVTLGQGGRWRPATSGWTTRTTSSSRTRACRVSSSFPR